MTVVNGSVSNVKIIIDSAGGKVIRGTEEDVFKSPIMWPISLKGIENPRFEWIIQSGGAKSISSYINGVLSCRGEQEVDITRRLVKDEHKSFASVGSFKDEYGSGGCTEAMIFLEDDVFELVISQFERAMAGGNIVYAISFHSFMSQYDSTGSDSAKIDPLLYGIVNGVSFAFGQAK